MVPQNVTKGILDLKHATVYLYVDNWEVKVVDDMLISEKMVIDELNGEHTMELSDTEMYLGDLVSNDGRNDKNRKEDISTFL